MTRRLEDFLDRMIEGYLTHDLVQMAGVSVGYPSILTSCGAIELFGALLSAETFDGHKGRTYFVDFWTEHLYPNLAHSESVGDAVYTLVRNGIAHQFMPHGQTGVMGSRPWAHLTVDVDGLILIDAHTLAGDVLMAYGRSVRSVITSTFHDVEARRMASRLDEILKAVEDDKSIAKAASTLRECLPATPRALWQAPDVTSGSPPTGPTRPFGAP